MFVHILIKTWNTAHSTNNHFSLYNIIIEVLTTAIKKK